MDWIIVNRIKWWEWERIERRRVLDSQVSTLDALELLFSARKNRPFIVIIAVDPHIIISALNHNMWVDESSCLILHLIHSGIRPSLALNWLGMIISRISWICLSICTILHFDNCRIIWRWGGNTMGSHQGKNCRRSGRVWLIGRRDSVDRIHSMDHIYHWGENQMEKNTGLILLVQGRGSNISRGAISKDDDGCGNEKSEWTITIWWLLLQSQSKSCEWGEKEEGIR